jgi:hypothetical protein
MKLKTWHKNAIAATFVVLCAGGSVVYDQLLAPKLKDATVYVATHPLAANHIITSADVRPILIDRSYVSPTAVTDEQQIIGKMAAQVIAQNQQITADQLESDPLVPGPGQYIAPIMPNWIAAVPDSLRRGDKVNIYAYPPHSPGGAPTPTGSMVSNLVQSQMPILTDIRVEYVRNGSNQEVLNAPPVTIGGGALGERENGTATPSKLELLVTQDQWNQLYSTVKAGNQLVFVYVGN